MDKKEYTYDERQKTPYATVNSKGVLRRLYQPKNVWELDLKDFVGAIDPKDMFVTSGEATIKARKLEKDLFKMAGKARKLVNALVKLKGENIWLEMTWQDGRLLLKAKNPRKHPEEKAKALEENFIYGKKYAETEPEVESSETPEQEAKAEPSEPNVEATVEA